MTTIRVHRTEFLHQFLYSVGLLFEGAYGNVPETAPLESSIHAGEAIAESYVFCGMAHEIRG